MKFAIIGLGYFGSALARELAESGHEVLAIDTDEIHIRDIRDSVAIAAVADGTDAEALAQLWVAGMDTSVIAIGEGFEASLMITAHCQKLGVRRVYTRVINKVHGHLLELMKVTGKIRAESLAADFVLQEGDRLIVFGALKDIDRFCESAD
jgi:trk system potassium uptake protein TrkA